MKISMLRWVGLGLLVTANLGVSAPVFPAEGTRAEHNKGLSVTVAFGSGLNTLPLTDIPRIPGATGVIFCFARAARNKIRSQPPGFATKSCTAQFAKLQSGALRPIEAHLSRLGSRI